MSLREYIESGVQQGSIGADELVGPPCPAPLRYLLPLFEDLASGRTAGFDVNPITWADMDAWSRLTGRGIDAFDVRALRRIDQTFLGVVRSGRKAKDEKGRKHG